MQTCSRLTGLVEEFRRHYTEGIGESKMTEGRVAAGLADALLAGPAGVDDFSTRLAQALDRKPHWLRSLAKRVFKHFGPALAYPQRRELIDFIRRDPGFIKAWGEAVKPRIRRFLLPVPTMSPRPGALADCALPELPTPANLADWLGITLLELDWFANLRSMIHSSDGSLSHYRCRWIPKYRGGYRLIESPKARLCAIQHKILREILDRVPAHPAAHGFRRGRSCMSYAAPHVGRLVVLRMDLKNFFGSVPARRVSALFQTLGYPDTTARYLTGLCTHRIDPAQALKIPGVDPGLELPWLERKKLGDPHLPQGAPSSPALANLCALHLDIRLAALAARIDANYTRYADDLAFSGNESMRRRVKPLSELIAAIALDEAFEVNFHKTRCMHRSDRQILTGIVVNEKMNAHRHDFDRLKAILHNCLRSGPESQNRDRHADFKAHLAGRVNYLQRLNPHRGARLQAMLEKIVW